MFHNTEIIKLKDNCFHHCASVASDGKNIALTAYYGRECTDEQRVFVRLNNLHLDLPGKTGNPVVWYQDGKFILLYSVFVDVDKDGNTPDTPVCRWKFCDNRLAVLAVKNGELTLENDHIIEGAFGLLGRCAPIMFNGKSLWPLYREKDPRCEVWTYTDNTLKLLSTFGEYDENEYNARFGSLGVGIAIQPSIISDPKTGSLFAYCRNVTRNFDHAWFSQSKDGLKWSKLQKTVIPNYNSSVSCINDTHLVIFNSDPNRERILLGSLLNKKAISLGVPINSSRKSTGYPNYCWHGDNLIIVHSNMNTIVKHEFSKDYLRMIFGDVL